jgi:hypothetical protein
MPVKGQLLKARIMPIYEPDRPAKRRLWCLIAGPFARSWQVTLVDSLASYNSLRATGLEGESVSRSMRWLLRHAFSTILVADSARASTR